MKSLIFTSLIILSFTACDLFTTRVGEEPNEIKSNWKPPVLPEDVIINLENALTDKNVENYIDCFVDTIFADQPYNFSASSEALSLYQIFIQGWGLNEERRYFRSITNKVPNYFPISLALADQNLSTLSGDSSIYSATYSIKLPVQPGDPFPQNYAGSLEFKMLRDSRSWWVIYFWKDTKSQTLPSWSELKGSSY
jgi:hypothetical protein